jgi:cyclophilin family peptidyl-prolyl cis-trans isomerase
MSLRPVLARRAIAAAVVGALVMGACGGGDDDEPVAEPESGTATDTAADTSDGGTFPGGVGSTKPDVEVPTDIPVELKVTDLSEGSGEPALNGDTVTLHYVGVLTEDGTEFDSSWDSQPFSVALGAGAVIPGFDQGLIGVKEGTRRQIDIPSGLAYGEAGAGGVIPPNAAITFVVDVLAIDRPTPATVPEQADPADCPAPDGSSERQDRFEAYPPFCIDVEANYTAEVVTNFGAFTIELAPEQAPLTVNNFVVLARYHYFDGTTCHRAIPGFVVQCGDPTATGTGDPGYRFDDELPAAGEYQIGSIAMANSGPNTNGSQFFIITGPDGASLPPQYSLFGEVTNGLDTTVAALDGVANPDDNGVPPLQEIRIESVTITES